MTLEFNVHKEVLTDTGEPIEAFELTTRKGYAWGFVHNNILCIHHIGNNSGQEHCVKGIMNMLCDKFKISKFRFLMVINPELRNIIHGKVVMIPPDAPGNPFGETIEEIHGEWLKS